MKAWLKFIVINSLFMGFFVFQNSLPPFLFSGVYFLIWILTVLTIIVMCLVFIIYAITEGEADMFESAKEALEKNRKTSFYYTADMAFDVCMLVVLGGLGHYIYGVFYLFTMLSVKLFRYLLINHE